MKSINASFSAMSRTITEMGKAMRQEHKPEIQEAERQRRTEPPVPSVATVPSEQQLAAAHVTPPETSVPSVATVPSVTDTQPSPHPEHNPPVSPSKPPALHDQVAQRSIPTETPVPSVPSVPGALLSRKSAHDAAKTPQNHPSLSPTSKLMCVPSQHLLSQRSQLSQLSQLPSPPGHGKPSLPADMQQSLNVGARLALALSLSRPVPPPCCKNRNTSRPHTPRHLRTPASIRLKQPSHFVALIKRIATANLPR